MEAHADPYVRPRKRFANRRAARRRIGSCRFLSKGPSRSPASRPPRNVTSLVRLWRVVLTMNPHTAIFVRECAVQVRSSFALRSSRSHCRSATSACGPSGDGVQAREAQAFEYEHPIALVWQELVALLNEKGFTLVETAPVDGRTVETSLRERGNCRDRYQTRVTRIDPKRSTLHFGSTKRRRRPRVSTNG